ncbi:class I SAM-dependent methyltransferase [Zavarzinella formosa]|uniref:class I SAM-dependent methyltransferase n=1 Tax=Zavarzinella formosa TaxID=360055 RepID=UPI0002D918FA|nr:class I SAM-dependent methyltransferase [Zavarzinella formosa]
MLDRLLEPEYMDTAEDAVSYDTMDHSGVNRVFIADFLSVWNGRSPIVDVGTGTAQIPVEFCRQSATGEIVALDAAEEMLTLARRNIEAAGFSSRVTCQQADAKHIPFADGSVAAVMSNSIIHHIPEPRTVFREMKRMAAAGATIFVRDLLRPEDTEELNGLVNTYCGNENPHQQRMFAESLHAALTLEEVREIVEELGFDPEDVKQTTDRHWTWSVAGDRS